MPVPGSSASVAICSRAGDVHLTPSRRPSPTKDSCVACIWARRGLLIAAVVLVVITVVQQMSEVTRPVV